MFLYAETMDLKRRSILFTLHIAYMADIINYKNNRRDFKRWKKNKNMSRGAERKRAETVKEKDSRAISIERPMSITIQMFQ